jgi:hypothetical protein
MAREAGLFRSLLECDAPHRFRRRGNKALSF